QALSDDWRCCRGLPRSYWRYNFKVRIREYATPIKNETRKNGLGERGPEWRSLPTSPHEDQAILPKCPDTARLLRPSSCRCPNYPGLVDHARRDERAGASREKEPQSRCSKLLAKTQPPHFTRTT